MFHELLAYFAGSLMLFAASAKGLFISVTIVALLAAAGVWWACGAFGRLWYVKFSRYPLHWVLTVFASGGTILFVFLIAASAYAPQTSMISALIWRSELTYDRDWQADVFAKAREAIKKAGYERPERFNDPKMNPMDHSESQRVSAKITAEEAHRHFREHRPLLSRVFWNDPSDGAEKVRLHLQRHFSGEVGQSAGETTSEVLIDIAESVPVLDRFLDDLDDAAARGGILSWILEGCGIEAGLRDDMTALDSNLKRIEREEAEGPTHTSSYGMHYAILANEILTEAIDKADRVRTVLILSLIGLYFLFMSIPFGVIGIAARREADLSRHQPVQY